MQNPKIINFTKYFPIISNPLATHKKMKLYLCTLLLIGLIINTGCVESYVYNAEAVLIKISPDGEKEWENIISCPDIQHTSPYINTHAVEIPGDGSFFSVQYFNRSFNYISHAVVIDNKGNLKKDIIVPSEIPEIIDLIPLEKDKILAFSRGQMIYTFNSEGEVISITNISELGGISKRSDYYFTSVIRADNGDIILAGDDKTPGYVYLLKISPEENKAKDKRIKIGGQPWINILIQTEDSGFLLGGSYSDSNIFPQSLPWIAKTDSQGNLDWQNNYGSKGDYLLTFYENQNGEYHIFYTSSRVDKNGLPHNEYIEEILDNNGKLKNSINYSVTEYPKMISEEGLVYTDFIFERNTQQNIEQGISLQVMKVHSNGEVEWENYFDWIKTKNTSSSINHEIIQTDDGGYMITGARYFFK